MRQKKDGNENEAELGRGTENEQKRGGANVHRGDGEEREKGTKTSGGCSRGSGIV